MVASGSPAQRFAEELEIFRTEYQTATQFLYAFLAVHAVAGEDRTVYRALNSAALFWNSNLGALQLASFIVLGRIFDQKSKHNVGRLLQMAHQHRGIFSRAALSARKQADGLNQTLADTYAANAHVLTPADLRNLARHLAKHRKLYEAKYRVLRHKYFAHKELPTPASVQPLFARTTIRELERLHAFLGSFYEALWQLFHNGKRPALRSQRYSVQSIRQRPSQRGRSKQVQEVIVLQAEQFLRTAAGLHEKKRAAS